MQEILIFISKHWPLCLAAVFALGWVMLLELRSTRAQYGISSTKLTALFNHEQATVVDIRDKSKFKQQHIVGSINIAQDQLVTQLASRNVDKSKALILVCDNGQKSGVCVKVCREAGYSECYSLNGGILGWEKAELPLTKK